MQGYMSVVLEFLLKTDVEIIGICTADPVKFTQKFRVRAGHLLRELKIKKDTDFIYKDPFAALSPPSLIAKNNKIQTYSVNELKSESFFSTVENNRPDLILAAGFPKLIPSRIVELASFGGYNIHPSVLPQYRGGTPVRWMIMNCEPKLGLSIHTLADKFDTGDIIFQKSIEMPHNCTWGEAELELLSLLPKTMLSFLEIIKEKTIKPIKQNESISTFFVPFRGNLHKIKWVDSADKILQQSLAVKPKTGLRSTINNQELCFWDIEPLLNIQKPAQPGQVIQLKQNKYLDVFCGKNQGIRVKSLLYNGKVRPIKFFFKNYSVKEGDVFN